MAICRKKRLQARSSLFGGAPSADSRLIRLRGIRPHTQKGFAIGSIRGQRLQTRSRPSPAPAAQGVLVPGRLEKRVCGRALEFWSVSPALLAGVSPEDRLTGAARLVFVASSCVPGSRSSLRLLPRLPGDRHAPVRSDPKSLAFRRAWRLHSVTESALGTDLTTCAITASYTELCGYARTAAAPARAHHRRIGDGAGAQSESTASL